MQREALAQLKELPVDSMPFGLCLFDPDWHQGVIGILASRMKERYHRPTFAFADAGDGMLKGSGRSVAGFHIRDALSVVATQHPDLISKYGGHAMAAGLSLPQENFPLFAEAFDAARMISPAACRPMAHWPWRSSTWNWREHCAMPARGGSTFRSRCSMGS